MTLRQSVFGLTVLLSGLALGAGDLIAATLSDFTKDLAVSDLVPGADRLGEPEGEPAIRPALAGDQVVGYVLLNADMVSAVGYSGKPINILVGIDDHGIVTGAKLVEHHEPIVLIGIPEKTIRAFLDNVIGYDAVTMSYPDARQEKGVDIISGATVTVLVMHDSVTRAAATVVRRLGIRGAGEIAHQARKIDPDLVEIKDWQTLLGEGAIRRLHMTVADANAAFAVLGDAEADARPEPGPDDATFIDLYAAQVTVPTIGHSLLGKQEWKNLQDRLAPGQQAILVMGNGRYSFKGSGYVRGGIFDRVQLVQDIVSARFRDRDHKRLGKVEAEGAPDFHELALFLIPADLAFDEAQPWRLELLIQRATGPIQKAFVTQTLSYQVPESYLLAAPAAAPDLLADQANVPLWKSVWASGQGNVAVLLGLLGLLTVFFFFQTWFVRRPKVLFWGRIGFLAFVLVWLGWLSNAQLSVVNVLTFFSSLVNGFSWDFFLMDPLVFILWGSVAAALLFWGRGPFCGWLCPFGALQELATVIGRRLKVPAGALPWGLHERLWPIKYILFLGLFGLSLYDFALAERLAEVEPFKTSIILNFVRDWPFVIYALTLVALGLVVERFFCRYLCPLGAALGIPGRLRMFEWLKRWPECGTTCQRCANECPVQAIHPEGPINPNECIYCLHCQELYFDETRCPHNIVLRLKRERREALGGKQETSAAPGVPGRG